MRDTYNAAKVGLLLLLTAAGGIFVYRLVDEGAQVSDGYRVYAIFEDVHGLVPKSRVLIAGIPVGAIDNISLAGDKARVDILLRPDVELHKDATVLKRSASLLGEMVLVIHPGSIDQPVVGDGSRIRVLEAAPSTDDILATVGSIADSVEKVMVQFERALGRDEAGNQLASSLRDLSEALAGINRTIQDNEQRVGNTVASLERITAEAEPRLARILANVELITQDVRGALNGDQTEADGGAGRVDSTLASIERSADQLESVLADVKEVSSRVAAGKGTIGRLTQDEQLIDEVEGVVEGIGDVVGGFSRLQTIVQLRSEYNFLANTFKSYVGLRLQPSEDRYYLFELIDDPRGLTSVTQRQIRQSPPRMGEPEFLQETITETKDSLRFSLIIAKRVQFATFRFGILESSGGLGVDFHVMDDRLELNLDMFQFGERSFARLRARLAYEVVRRLWIVGGMDDLLNRQSNDFFMGLQLRFNDEDLKSILPFAPAGAAG